jgi:hypothetical protein
MASLASQDQGENEKEVEENLPFCSLNLSVVETVSIYAAMQSYLQIVSSKDNLDMSLTMITLMKRIRPQAVAAAQHINGVANG